MKLNELLLSNTTKELIEKLSIKPPHALGLVAPYGFGKSTLSELIAANILDTPAGNIVNQPYIKIIEPIKNVIAIEKVREITDFLKLKTTGQKSIRRVIIVKDAQTMTTEAQNALLKTLEEPPEDTVLILTIADTSGLLPTILSRLSTVNLTGPAKDDVIRYFTNLGHDIKTVQTYALMGDNRAGLMSALLNDQQDHEMINAINTAKSLLSQDTFQRLTQVEQIANSKTSLLVTEALIQISRTAMNIESSKETSSNQVLKKWAGILAASEKARDNLQKNGQPKLVLTDLFLHM